MEVGTSSSATENSHLRRALEQLLNTTELNLDDLEDDTREAIGDALKALGRPIQANVSNASRER